MKLDSEKQIMFVFWCNHLFFEIQTIDIQLEQNPQNVVDPPIHEFYRCNFGACCYHFSSNTFTMFEILGVPTDF